VKEIWMFRCASKAAVFLSSALALIALAGPSGGVVGEWTVHVNSSNMFCVFIDGANVWGASSGGAVRFTPGTAQFMKVVRDRPGSLVNNDVSCVAVSDGGLTWFGTRGFGLNLLDGNQWVLFTAGITELPSDNILSLASVGSVLWAGTTAGLARFEGSEFQEKFDVASTGGGIPNNTINSILADQDTVWCATAGGVARGVKPGASWTWQTVNGGLSSLNVLCVGRSGSVVWVGAADGTYEFDGSVWVKRGGTPSWQPVALQEAGGNLYAAAGDSGIFIWQDDAWSSASPAWLEAACRDLASDGSGNLWCASSEGFLLFDGAGWQQIEPPGPAYNYVEDISVSMEGDVWAASHSNSAAMRFDGTRWILYDNSTTGGGFQFNWLFSVLASSSGDVWFGHCCCPFCRVDRVTDLGGAETWDNFPFYNVKEIREDALGVIWFSANGGGIYVYDPVDSSWRNILPSLGKLSSNRIETIAPASSRLRWVGHALAGVDMWDDAGTAQEADDIWRHFTTVDGLASMNITSSALVDNKVYFGTPSGISVFQDTLWLRDYDAADLFPASAQVNDLTVDALGNVWVATSSGVVKIAASEEITVYKRSGSGLVDDHVRSVGVDNLSGRVWFGTPTGLSVLHTWIPSAGENLEDSYVYPNPFRPDRGHSEIRLGGIPSSAEAWAYDLAGRELKALGTIQSGERLWDGRDQDGRAVPAGVYLIKLQIGNATCIRKVAVIR
jgi:ligand-binding sensor domain-containing protein